MLAEVSFTCKCSVLDFTSSVISDPSAAQEKLALWLVVVVGIAAAVELLAYFLGFPCLIYIIGERWQKWVR